MIVLWSSASVLGFIGRVFPHLVEDEVNFFVSDCTPENYISLQQHLLNAYFSPVILDLTCIMFHTWAPFIFLSRSHNTEFTKMVRKTYLQHFKFFEGKSGKKKNLIFIQEGVGKD